MLQCCPSELVPLLHRTPCLSQLVLPVAPPVALYGGRVHEGQLGLKFMRVKPNPWDMGGFASSWASGHAGALWPCCWQGRRPDLFQQGCLPAQQPTSLRRRCSGYSADTCLSPPALHPQPPSASS